MDSGFRRSLTFASDSVDTALMSVVFTASPNRASPYTISSVVTANRVGLVCIGADGKVSVHNCVLFSSLEGEKFDRQKNGRKCDQSLSDKHTCAVK